MSELNWPLVGHEPIKNFFEQTLIDRRFSHAYLFCGPKEVGKTALAKQFIKFLVCQEYQRYFNDSKITAVKQCQTCLNCRQFDKGLYSDFYLLERGYNSKTGKRKKNISVEQLRDLHEKIQQRSFNNSHKAVLIPEAEALTEEAGNSLLKHLEEPTPRTVFILITTNREAILPTIRSRSQIVNFQPVSRDVIYDYLLKLGASRDLAQELSALANGRPTVATRFLHEPQLYAIYKKRQAELLELLSLKNSDKLRILNKLFDKSASGAIFDDFLERLSMVARDLFLIKSNQPHLISEIFLRESLQSLASKFSGLPRFIGRIEKAREFIRRNLQPRFVIEELLINQ